MLAPPTVYSWTSPSMTEVQGMIKIEAIAQVDDKILSSLGWTNLQHVKDQKLIYQFGIFSTCYPGKAVPDWLPHKSKGPSVSFTMSSSSMNKTIRGMNISCVHTFSGTGIVYSYLKTKVQNVTKNHTWVYDGSIDVVGETDKDIVWLSHWMFGNNEIKDGDEVCITIEEVRGIMVRECAVCPVYINDRDKNEEDPLSYYKSWKHIIGGDLSAFQLTSGDYRLRHFLVISPEPTSVSPI